MPQSWSQNETKWSKAITQITPFSTHVSTPFASDRPCNFAHVRYLFFHPGSWPLFFFFCFAGYIMVYRGLNFPNTMNWQNIVLTPPPAGQIFVRAHKRRVQNFTVWPEKTAWTLLGEHISVVLTSSKGSKKTCGKFRGLTRTNGVGVGWGIHFRRLHPWILHTFSMIKRRKLIPQPKPMRFFFPFFRARPWDLYTSFVSPYQDLTQRFYFIYYVIFSELRLLGNLDPLRQNIFGENKQIKRRSGLGMNI